MTDDSPTPDTVAAHFANWPRIKNGTPAELSAYFLASGSDSSLTRDHAIVSIAQSLERIAHALEVRKL
jgi:hypothetical protein